MSLPKTDPSLIRRLRGAADEDAWSEFVELYRPAILRLARRKGLQPSDAEDLAQAVLVSVMKAVDRWEPDAGRARFRTWLFTVANHKIIDVLRRRSIENVTGDSSVHRLLSAHEQRSEDSRLLRFELRRLLFHRAATVVKEELDPVTWNCFRLMAIEGLPAVEVAKQTEKTIGAVYAAKARVARRLIEYLREYPPALSINDAEV